MATGRIILVEFEEIYRLVDEQTKALDSMMENAGCDAIVQDISTFRTDLKLYQKSASELFSCQDRESSNLRVSP